MPPSKSHSSSPSRKSLLHKGWAASLTSMLPEKGDKHHTAPVLRRYLLDSAAMHRASLIKKLSKKFPKEAVETQLVKERFFQKRVIRSSTRVAAKVAMDSLRLHSPELRKKILELLLAQRLDVEMNPRGARERGLLHEHAIMALLRQGGINERDFTPLFMRIYNALSSDFENDKPVSRALRGK